MIERIQKELQEMSEESYADFQRKLCPTVKAATILGVRVPKLRTLAKGLKAEGVSDEFLMDLPHDFYEENILQSILISEIKNYDHALKAVDRFLPHIDNWAVCDSLSPKIFAKNKEG